MNADIDARVRELFQQLPFLIGFSLDRELCVCDVEIDTWPGYPSSDRDYGEIGGMLAEVIGGIIEEGAADELRERTFARSLH
jgi:hypothetical protein